MTFIEELLLEYSKDMAAAQPLDRRAITAGYARILELREDEARVDELGQIICHKHGFGKDSCPQLKERIAELTNHNNPIRTVGHYQNP